jgi:DnaJ-class molecular chaperone
VGRKVKVRIEEDCPECGGSGEVLASMGFFARLPPLRWVPCPGCEGTGTVRSVYEVDEADLEVEED